MRYRYTKYIPNAIDEIDMDDLVSRLSDLLLSRGFGRPDDLFDDGDRTMQALHDAILEALSNGGVLPTDLFEQIFARKADGGETGASTRTRWAWIPS
jgi:hypothetical protein